MSSGALLVTDARARRRSLVPVTRQYRKQEQEPASEEILEVAPGVLRLQLPISLPGLGHVNCYALYDGNGVALVDPGLPGHDSWEALISRLKRAEIPLARVHTAIVTHSHPDHFGGAPQLREETGADILTHESFTSTIATTNDDLSSETLDMTDEEILELWKQRIRDLGPTPWGTQKQPPPDEAILRFIRGGRDVRGTRRFFTPTPTLRVVDNQPLRFAGREWFVMHTPGHTTDHLCLWDPSEGVFLSGDHVLPTITPHIAGSTQLDDPLATFFESLDRVAALDGVTTVLPAHGHPLGDLKQRCDHIKSHHAERLGSLRDAAADTGDAPVEEWMKILFKQRSWGEMAASETYAHLEHLRVSGEATFRRDSNGLLHYQVATSPS